MNRRDFIKLAGISFLGGLVLNDFKLKNADALGMDSGDGQSKNKFKKPEHIVLIMQENRSFDHYFGMMDKTINGQPERVLELGITDGMGGSIKPYDLGYNYITPDRVDPNHSWEGLHTIYNNGRMDGYFLNGINQPVDDYKVIMGYYDTKKALYPYYLYASNFTLCQNYFHSIMAPTQPNRLYQIAGQSNGHITDAPPKKPYEFSTIFNRLEKAKISWKIYVEGWPNPKKYVHHWVPVIWFESFMKDKRLWNKIRPADEYFGDIKNGTLPKFSWLVPDFKNSEHPPADVKTGMLYTVKRIEALRKSPLFSKSAIFLNWDECGGFYDHVVPPVVDYYGLGMRVGCIIISPFVKKGYISNVMHEHASILKYAENLWGLDPLTDRDRYANGFEDAFLS
ncbi:MAG: alkaline phosphatase family protein [Deltaproteobacteria bacterium]|nr:alkaline phosphatase family protein [Deltaproteobacteria bacterium]